MGGAPAMAMAMPVAVATPVVRHQARDVVNSTGFTTGFTVNQGLQMQSMTAQPRPGVAVAKTAHGVSGAGSGQQQQSAFNPSAPHAQALRASTGPGPVWNANAMCDGEVAANRVLALVENKGMSPAEAKQEVIRTYPMMFVS